MVQNQQISVERLKESQALYTPDLGPGLYMTKSRTTAQQYADVHGRFGRQGGSAILRMLIREYDWNTFLVRLGAIEDAPTAGMPGHLQCFVPLYAVPVFNVFARFLLD